ncbi:hypothetical protein IWW37_005664 [Coemansia sp. RSA 2050]|nr:hypothetical protein IWW37_005664 [Coemansia sp. RSA 2050]KAJ2729709.1 hypothetical protein IW152_005520 [Coemansia sp. BCRC 34962]
MSLGAPPDLDKTAPEPPEEVVATLQQVAQALRIQRGISSGDRVHGGYMWDIVDKSERHQCLQWLGRAVEWATKKWMLSEQDEWERVAEMAAKLTSELCGKGASGAVQRRVSLWRRGGDPLLVGGIAVHEPSFVHADVGCKTWGAAILLARRIARQSIDISMFRRCIELGSGTGLLGLAAGCALRGLEGASVTTTDYLPVLIQAAREGAQANGLLDNGAIVPMKMDWFEMAQDIAALAEDRGEPTRGTMSIPAASYLDAVHRDATAAGNEWEGRIEPALGGEESKGAFDLVIAADVLYEMEHCYVIALLANHLLAAAKPGAGELYLAPQFIITTPLRSTHWREVAAFEAEMAAIPTMRLVSRDDTTRADDLDSWISGIRDKDSATMLANDQSLARAIDEDAGDSLVYRTYIYERC